MVDTKRNPSLEKYKLIQELANCEEGSKNIGEEIMKIDFECRSDDSKFLENICRKGGRGLMLAGALFGAGAVCSYYAEKPKTVCDVLAAVGIFSIIGGTDLYNKRRIEWDDYYKKS
ncbi:hypothetical protein ACFLZZ_04160 [Nanoarchaeota archaeon]